MTIVHSVGMWTLRFSTVLTPVPVVETAGINRFWGYGLLYPALAATWATGRWQRRRQFARLRDRPEPRVNPTAGVSFWPHGPIDEVVETVDAIRAPADEPERRDRAMRNLVDSIKNDGIETDLRIQLVQDLVDLGGRDMALRLLPVAASSEVDIEVRLEAAEHMARFATHASAKALESIATDTAVDDKYRLDAAIALVDSADEAAGVALMRMVTDHTVSEYVRHSAANALRRISRTAAATALRHLATAPLLSTRLRIICAEQLAEDDPVDAIAALWRIIKGVESSMDYNLGIDAAEALGGICPVSGVEAFSALAVDANFSWWGRIEAAYRLGRLGVSDGFDLLSDFARADELDNVYGLAALDRLFQLENQTGTLETDD